MHARFVLCVLVLTMVFLTGCGSASRLRLAEHTGGSAALYRQFQSFDGHTGEKLTFADVVRRTARADVILFGELHGHAVCNAIEAQLFHALLQQAGPSALAMEFFEKDTQAALRDYLDGHSDESAFMTQTRQNRDYLLAHRPLIEMCRTDHAPVIAANAPRRLVREYRLSKLSFDEFRRSRGVEDQQWLPRSSEHLPGPYFDRFVEVIKSHPPAPAASTTTAPALLPLSDPGGPSSAAMKPAVTAIPDPFIVSFRPQLLWDDSMAESVADFRAANLDHRVMLIVGRFHVANEGGTLQKFRQRRPGDKVLTIVFSSRENGAFAMDKEDANSADIVICGLHPPEKRELPAAMPASAPVR